MSNTKKKKKYFVYLPAKWPLTDITKPWTCKSVVNYWNINLKYLSEVWPDVSQRGPKKG